MSKNIVIYSDGTGQRDGVLFDERRSNIYKFYRSTRCGPDSIIDPAEQLTFYDPGIGTVPQGVGLLGAMWTWIHNLVSQATGLGLTKNIVACYAALISMWEPGDRIFLFGFSRGAYTVRCLGGVIALCGIPTRDGGKPAHRDNASTKRIAGEAIKETYDGWLRNEEAIQRIAREAVKDVYQHTSSRKEQEATPRQKELLAQRKELARQFRLKYGSGYNEGPNAYPYFIGVFDTVASLANPVALASLILGAFFLVVFVSWLVSMTGVPFLYALAIIVVIAALSSLTAYLFSHVKADIQVDERPPSHLFHLTQPRMKFYDYDLNPNVAHAKHALSIDENRAAFERVKWRVPHWRETPDKDPSWFKQIWFAGVHSDVGGSYSENESRLSDIALEWMRDEAVAAGLLIDQPVLRLFPLAAGMQHDECKRAVSSNTRARKNAIHPLTLSAGMPTIS